MIADDDRVGMQQYRRLTSSEELSESFEKVSEPTNTIDGPIEETNYDFNNSSEEFTESYEEVSEAGDNVLERIEESARFPDTISNCNGGTDEFSDSIAELNDAQGEDILKVIVKTSISHVFKPLETTLSLLQVCKHFYF